MCYHGPYTMSIKENVKFKENSLRFPAKYARIYATSSVYYASPRIRPYRAPLGSPCEGELARSA